jgi:hypothetical protein
MNDHKFGKCNTEKKFYRKDHLNQHLIRFHGATSLPNEGAFHTVVSPGRHSLLFEY